MRRSIVSCTSVLNERVVPRSTTSFGITFQVSPPWNCVTLTTAASTGCTVRLGIVCSACTIALPTTIGSMPLCGMAACAPRPVTVISKMSKPAIIGPGITPNWPTGMPGQLCMP